jgi:hypothetical protein
MQLKQDCPCDRLWFGMTNESCHSESRRREESLLLNDEILRPEKIGTQHDIFLQSHCGLDPQSISNKSHRGL